MNYYPVSLNLDGRRCVVIGSDAIAAEKVLGLREAGAQITIVAPELTGQLAELAAQGVIDHCQHRYQPGDLAGRVPGDLHYRDPAVARRAWQEATERNILFNSVDDPPHCNFIAPAIVRRGDLTVALSTGGKAPALAVRLREWLERELGPEHARFLELAGRLRGPLARRYPEFGERKARWYRLLDSDVLYLLRQGEEATARQRMIQIMGVEPEEDPA